MILPIVSFGNSILRCKCSPVDENHPIEDILKNMYETMYNAQGYSVQCCAMLQCTMLQ